VVSKLIPRFQNALCHFQFEQYTTWYSLVSCFKNIYDHKVAFGTKDNFRFHDLCYLR
jgi:hypothetical protein